MKKKSIKIKLGFRCGAAAVPAGQSPPEPVLPLAGEEGGAPETSTSLRRENRES